jgi:predicted enzyme related to lactoylglutathione lyase
MSVTFRRRLALTAASVAFVSLIITIPMEAQTSTTKPAGTDAAQQFKLIQIDMAIVHMDKMVNFYTSVLDAKLTSRDVQGMKMYSGTMLGMTFVMAPNELAGVVAEQSRHQLEVVVTDIEAIADKAKAAGGNLRDGIQTNGDSKVLVVEDPDGNTVIFHQKI